MIYVNSRRNISPRIYIYHVVVVSILLFLLEFTYIMLLLFLQSTGIALEIISESLLSEKI